MVVCALLTLHNTHANKDISFTEALANVNVIVVVRQVLDATQLQSILNFVTRGLVASMFLINCGDKIQRIEE